VTRGGETAGRAIHPFHPGIRHTSRVRRPVVVQNPAHPPLKGHAVTRTLLSMFLFGLAAQPAPTRAGDDVAATPTVAVTARKEAVVRKLDKTVHDVADAPRAANGSAQDVLQSTPEIAVTADGRIAVKGNAQVTVLVDGKPMAAMAGSGEERAVALQTMSGADIASVEVITNPSAAYNANGGAIVNIVLKRNRKPGAHAQLRGSATDQGLWNAGASGDLTRQSISVHGSLALRHDGTLKIRESRLDWHDPAGQDARDGELLQTSRVFVRRAVASAAVGADVALGEFDTVGLAARHNGRRSRPVFDVLNQGRSGDAATIYHRISDGPNEQSDDSAILQYSRRHADTAFKAMFQRSTMHALVDKSYRDVFVEPVRDPDYGHGATRTARRLDQATLDWSRAGQDSQWGMGLDHRQQVDELANYQARVDRLLGVETPDPATTNAYAVTTTVDAAYLTSQRKLGSWEMLLGGRAERTALQVRPDASRARHWNAFNPSLHVKRALDAGIDVTLSYRRSLQMPDPRDLNPFTTYLDAQNVSRGNPGLQPQRVSAWEAGVNREGEHLSGSMGAFYRTSRDTVFDARSVDGDVITTTKRNGGRARSVGMTASLDWKAAPALQLGVDGGVYRVMLATPDRVTSDIGTLVRQDGVAGYVNVKAAWRAGLDNVTLDAHGQSAAVTPLGRLGATSSVNLGWKHALSKTLSLTVDASDIFDGSRRSYRTETAAFRQAGFDHFVARRLYVGFVKKIE
jgi:outer membrane receptor protein involved in Fe transport